jgi:hypothetical protein
VRLAQRKGEQIMLLMAFGEAQALAFCRVATSCGERPDFSRLISKPLPEN